MSTEAAYGRSGNWHLSLDALEVDEEFMLSIKGPGFVLQVKIPDVSRFDWAEKVAAMNEECSVYLAEFMTGKLFATMHSGKFALRVLLNIEGKEFAELFEMSFNFSVRLHLVEALQIVQAKLRKRQA